MPIPFGAASQFVTAAVGVASLFRPAGATVSAQIEMLAAINMQLRNVQDGIILIVERLDELREITLKVPKDTVEQMRINELMEARSEFSEWCTRQESYLRRYGIEASADLYEPNVLDHCFELARSARRELMGDAEGVVPDYSVALLVSTAAYVELSAISTLLSNDSGAGLTVKSEMRFQAIQAYREWFNAVVESRGDGSLEDEIHDVRARRRSVILETVSNPKMIDYVVDVEPIWEDFQAYQHGNNQYLHPSGGNDFGRWVVTDRMEAVFTLVDPISLFGQEGGGELLIAFDELVEAKLLEHSDNPCDVVVGFRSIGPRCRTLVKMPRPGHQTRLPYGGIEAAKDEMIWSGQRTFGRVTEEQSENARQISSQLVEDGVRLITLASIKYACRRAIDWLNHLEEQARDVVGELDP